VEEIMGEVYTCECGGNVWLIHGRKIECYDCSNMYVLAIVDQDGKKLDIPANGSRVEEASSFNDNILYRV
jgi:hypothetical protein